MWWPEICLLASFFEKKLSVLFVVHSCHSFFVVFVIVVFHALFMRIFVFVLPQPYFPPLLFCPKWCLCLLHCAFPFGLAFILAM